MLPGSNTDKHEAITHTPNFHACMTNRAALQMWPAFWAFSVGHTPCSVSGSAPRSELRMRGGALMHEYRLPGHISAQWV